METSKKNIQVQQWVAFVSVLLLAAKLVAYFLTNSVAILTDALESIVNVVAGFVGLFSLYISAKPGDSDHPYGHGKIEFVSAAIEGSMISVAGLLIIYNAVKKYCLPSTTASAGCWDGAGLRHRCYQFYHGMDVYQDWEEK